MRDGMFTFSGIMMLICLAVFVIYTGGNIAGIWH